MTSTELKMQNLATAKNILAAKGLTFANVGISDKIKINSLVVDYTTELKAKVADITTNMGISERAAIALILESEISKIQIDTTIEAAEKTILDAEKTIGKANTVKAIKAAKVKEPKAEKAPKVVVVKEPKVVKIDETLKIEVNETVKEICHIKGLIYPQIVISDISIKFAEFYEITGILAIAEAKMKAKQLMAKTGITSERITLIYLNRKEITFVPVVRTTEKTFSINFPANSITIVIDDKGKFNFHQKSEYTAVNKVLMSLQAVLNKIGKMPNPMQKLKELSNHLNDAKVKSFKECTTQTEIFLTK